VKRTALVILTDADFSGRQHHEKADASPTLAEEQSDLFAERYSHNGRNPQEDYDFIELAIAGDFNIGRVLKFRVRKISSRSFFGKGQVEEVMAAIGALKPDVVVTNAPLSPVHQRNLEEAWNVDILTRADIIFEIFEANAKTSEGRLQVELARLKYALPRFVRVGKQMSRTGGDMGTRGGGGEQITRLSKDRIRKRILRLDEELEHVRKVRELRRKQRVRSGVFTATIIGYTNSGKSSLINALTKSGEEVAERYFTTLDPAARSLFLEDGSNAVICDTVGFLDGLPKELLTAFRATMDEVAQSDLLLHVVDASQENVEFRLESGAKILEEYRLANIPRAVVFNKADLLDDESSLEYLRGVYPESVVASAVTGKGLPELMALIRRYAKAHRKTVETA
jgi:GTP-binding protein HflX